MFFTFSKEDRSLYSITFTIICEKQTKKIIFTKPYLGPLQTYKFTALTVGV